MTDPVLIVGAGPTGLTAALELSRFGIPARLIEKAPEPATTSRAIGVQARTLELLHQRGLADEMVRLGNPARGGSIYGGGKRLFRMDFSRIGSRFNYLLFISQAETERILREAIGRHGVTIERGVELVAIAQDALSHAPSPVTAMLRHEDGTLEQARAPWLISAEGAHSLARTTLDLGFKGKTLHEEYALGDLHLEGALPESDFHIFSSERGFLALFPLGGDHFRLIASNAPGKPQPGTAPTLDELQRIYDQRASVPARFHDMSWSSWFRINSRMVRRLRIGRILLGGDAAHIHSPAGAQGMNTGIQDMINLGWKLALVMQGRAPAALLDTYERDRLPVMRTVLFQTENLTGLIGAENTLLRATFNTLAPHVGGNALVQENATGRMSQLALGYRGSPLSANHTRKGSLHAGDRVPDLVVRRRMTQDWTDGQLLDMLDPSRFTVLVMHADETGSANPELLEAARTFGDLVTIVEVSPPADKPERDRYSAMLGGDARAVLVRPDGYAGLTAMESTAPRHLATYWRTHLQLA